MNILNFPFSGIVGQEAMKTALLLNAVDPSIGGVLIKGQKGTAKSTAVRSLAALLPPLTAIDGCCYHCAPDQPASMCNDCRDRYEQGQIGEECSLAMPLVELPLGATEDRVVGNIELQETLRTGERHFEPGLLAAANRGILYVDEVNLLEDHLIDLLLDAAASGINRVEREGLCVIHPARFILIGTMNPEEGDLRPQFLDRFGLTVTVEGLSDSSARKELLRRRFAFDQSPQDFIHSWQEHEHFLSAEISRARTRLASIRVPDKVMNLTVELVIELGIHGHRADIALLKAAKALAALMEKSEVSVFELQEVAEYVLPHRLPGSALLKSDESRNLLKDAFEKINTGKETAASIDPDLDAAYGDYLCEFEFPGPAAAGNMLFEAFKKKLQNA